MKCLHVAQNENGDSIFQNVLLYKQHHIMSYRAARSVIYIYGRKQRRSIFDVVVRNRLEHDEIYPGHLNSQYRESKHLLFSNNLEKYFDTISSKLVVSFCNPIFKESTT